MQTRPGVEAKLVSISLVWRRKRPSKETVAYIHTHEHTQTHKEHASFKHLHKHTHAHTHSCTRTHKQRERERDGISHEQNAHRYTDEKPDHTRLPTYTHTHT